MGVGERDQSEQNEHLLLSRLPVHLSRQSQPHVDAPRGRSLAQGSLGGGISTTHCSVGLGRFPTSLCLSFLTGTKRMILSSELLWGLEYPMKLPRASPVAQQ